MNFNIPQIKIPGLPFLGGGKKEKKGKKKEVESYEDKLIEYLTSPSTIIPHVNDIQIGKYHRIIGAINYPRIVKPGWLTSLIEMNLDFDLSIHISPYPVERSIKILENELKKQKTDLYGLKAEGKIIPQALIQKHQDTKALLEAIQQGTEKMFTLSLYIDAKSHDTKELDKLTSKITAKMNSIMITPKVPSFQMQEALKSVLPIGQDKLRITRDLTSSAAAACFPFAITSLEHQTSGILIGFNQTNNIPIIIDPFTLSNPNIMCLGTSGGGKSIGKDEPVLIRESGVTKIVKIGKFIDDLILKNGSERIDDLEGVLDPGIKVYTFNQKLKGEWGEVLMAARKEAPSLCYNIKTKSGRKIKTTGDHNLVVIRKGKIINIKSVELKKGDYVPVPRIVDIDTRKKELNLLSLLKDKKLYLVNAEQTIAKNYQLIKKRLPIDRELDRYLYKYREDRAIPIHYFLKILKTLQIRLARAELKKLRIRAGNGHQSIPVIFPLSNEIMRLLGYITSEGCVNKQAVLISNKERAVIGDIKRICQKLGIKSFEANRGINITCKALVELIGELAGGKSGEKRVPDILFSVSSSKVGEYLKAYFEGDGCVEHNKVTATSKSSGLVNDLSYLLLRFGMVGRIQEKHKTATNSGYRGIYHQITLSGKKTIEIFGDRVGFISKKKNRKLLHLMKKVGRENTNVDLIPEIGGVIKRIDNVLHFGKRRRNYAIINKSFTPSRTMLRKIVREIDTRVTELNEVEEGISELEKLPDLLEMVEIARQDKELNSRLWNELDDSWRLMKNELVEPGICNVFRAGEIVTGMHFEAERTREFLANGLATLGLGVGPFDPSLYNFIKGYSKNIQYKKIEKVVGYLAREYRKLNSEIKKIEPEIEFLRILADSDLFWDKVSEIKKERCKDDYVYDLEVENEMFLSGFGGLFVHNSYCVKLMLMREFMEGVEINIIDPQAEYTDLAVAFKGKTIRIAPDSDTIINPFDLNDQTLDEKKLSLLAFFRVLLGELTEGQRAILDDAIDRTYEDVGITKDPRTWVKRPPILGDLYEHVLPLTRSEREIIYKPAMAVTNRLKSYIDGPLKFLNQQTKIDLDNRMISFDIRDIPDIGKGTIMFLILEYVYNAMKKSKTRKMLVIDEAWTVLSAGEEAEYVFRLVKTCRKFNLSLVMITQDVEDVLTSRAGRAVMTNTATKLLMQQDPTVMDQISERFHLNEAEEHLLRTAGKGSALLTAENLRVPIYIQSSKEEHRIITTKPDELKEMIHKGKAPEVRRELGLEFDITQKFHRKIKLTTEQIQTLQKIGFTEMRVQNLEGRGELFIIKNETDQVDEHFVLENLITEKIREHTDKISIHTTKLPDILFESKEGKIIAIEIVAEDSMKTNLERMEEKHPILKKYDDYFFVVLDAKLKKYETFGEILIPIQVLSKINSYFEVQ